MTRKGTATASYTTIISIFYALHPRGVYPHVLTLNRLQEI